jgi:hypothetical protein
MTADTGDNFDAEMMGAYQAEVFDIERNERLGYLVQADESRLRVMSFRPLKQEETLRLRVAWSEGEGWQESFEVEGETLSCVEGTNTDTYETELRLITPTADVVAGIKRLTGEDPGRPTDGP